MDEASALPNVAAGELLLASIGLSHVIARQPRRVTNADLRHATMLPKEIRRSFRRFYGLPSPKAARSRRDETPPFKYMTVAPKLLEAVEPEHNEAVIDAFGEGREELGMEYAAAAMRALTWLRNEMPQRAERSMFTSRPVLPSDTELHVFRRFYEVADHPMRILDELERGTLIPDQVRAVSQLYPTLYQAMRDVAQGEVIRARAAKMSFDLTPAQNRRLEILFRQELNPIDVQGVFAAAKEAKAEGGQGGDPPGVRSTSKATEQLMSATDRVSSKL